MCPDPGWVFHEPGEDGAGYSGWLYHYADGLMVTEDGVEYAYAVPGSEPRAEVEPEALLEAEPEATAGPESAPEESDPVSTDRPGPHPERLSRAGSGRLSTSAAHGVKQVELIVVAALALLLALGVGTVLAHRWTAKGDHQQATAGSPRLVPPPTVPANGEYVHTRVRASGDLAVEHWIRSARPISTMRLAIPPVLSGRSGVVAHEVRVQSNHGGPRAEESTGAGTRIYSLHRASLVRIDYVLSGVVVKGSAPAGRALVEVTALDVSYHHDRVPRTLVVQGGRLVAAACAGPAADHALVRCGRPDRSGWRVTLGPGARNERVLAQVALP